MKNVILALLLAFTSSCGNELLNDSTDNSVETTTTNENSFNPIDNSYSDSSIHNNHNPSNPNQSGTNPDCVDIAGEGFLWKPISDSDGKPAILFPSAYSVRFLSVKLVTNGAEEENTEFSGYGNPDRQTWRAAQTSDNYTGLILVENGSEQCTIQVPDPSERYEGSSSN